MPDPSAIEALGIVKRFGTLTAVDAVDLRLEAGAALALLGPNGAGKTTLVEMLEGLQRPDSGTIRIFDRAWDDSDPEAVRGKLGVCLQETRLPERLSCLETLRLFASFHGLESTRAEAVLEQVGLTEKADARTRNLSGGQRQRLALGVALLPRPRLLLLDEPTTGLDPAARREIWDLIEALKREGCALLLTTHYMEEAEALCPEVALMHKGRLLARGSVPRLLAEHAGGDRIEAVFASTDAPDFSPSLPGRLSSQRSGPDAWTYRVEDLARALPALLAETASQGLTLRSLTTRKATLEDLFMALAGERLAVGAEAA
jgi:ABC-2 type transport system ATP-binding protein